VSNPCTRAPCLSACLTASSWASDKRGACPVGPALRNPSSPRARPLGMPAAGVLAGDTKLVGDLGLGAAGGEQLTGLQTDLFKRLAVGQTPGVAAVGGWSHLAMLPGPARPRHWKGRTSLTVVC
jgi:hypothetical protein